jgi:uncharacterized protein (TIGR03083 family)
MNPAVTPSIDHLEQTWRSIEAMCSDLTDEDWETPSGCPGWSVKDLVSHLVDYESRALGRPGPEHVPAVLAHTKNALGEGNEVGVDFRRATPGSEVLAEFRDVVKERLGQLQALSADDLQREITTPAGPGTVADMLTLRVMDTWTHEQDIRRALGRRGHLTGGAVDETVEHFAQFLPLIVGKRAGAPDGSTVVFAVGRHRYEIAVDGGRAQMVAASPDAPSVELVMPPTTFVALVGGRTDAPDDVELRGDAALGRTVLDQLGFMP